MTEPVVWNAESIRVRLAEVLSADRLRHVEHTATLARHLAVAHDLDPDRAEIAALLHDVAADYSDSELLALAEDFSLPVSLTEVRAAGLLHGKVGAEILRRDWHIGDDELLDAVRYHITGHPHMSPLAKIGFLADKLEPSRDQYYGGLGPIRDLAERDLDAAILRLYAWRIDQLVVDGKAIDQTFVAARNRLVDDALASRR